MNENEPFKSNWSQFVTSSRKHRGAVYRPQGFTEHGDLRRAFSVRPPFVSQKSQNSLAAILSNYVMARLQWNWPFVKNQLIIRESRKVALDSTVQRPSCNAMKFCQITVNHDLLAANQENQILNPFDGNQCFVRVTPEI